MNTVGPLNGEGPVTVARRYLELLAEHGIETLFLNAGTDFAPLVEAYAAQAADSGPALPEPVLASHENVVAGMAHGAYLVSGRPQAVMFHVSVGTANAVCAVANAARDNVPMLVTAGRTPILESGALGARDTSIHWAQEMYDQAGMLREFVKWDYELRDGRQVGAVLDRGISLAMSHPRGPVYLSLPREVLAEAMPAVPLRGSIAVSAGPHPDPASVDLLADKLVAASFPVIVASASGSDVESVALLGELCEEFSIGVAEHAPRYMNVDPEHPLHLGYQMPIVFANADVLCFLECDVPWIESRSKPDDATFVAQVGIDPLFAQYPMRSHRSDITVSSTPSAFVKALSSALHERRSRIDPGCRVALTQTSTAQRAATERARARSTADGPITKTFLAAALGDALGPSDIVFNEYWAQPELLRRTSPGTYFYLPPSGGLGWALPAALGARYAGRGRTVAALVGDGAYMFANPAACHHASAKHDLPVLTVIANNSTWGAVDYATRSVYPDGLAVTNGERRLSDLGPSPDFERYAEASGGLGLRVTERSQLDAAIATALHAVRTENRQALLNVICS